MTAEEHVAIMKKLKPVCRVYFRSESGRMVDMGWECDENMERE